MKIHENGVSVGPVRLTDFEIARISWLLPAVTVPLAMLVHILEII